MRIMRARVSDASLLRKIALEGHRFTPREALEAKLIDAVASDDTEGVLAKAQELAESVSGQARQGAWGLIRVTSKSASRWSGGVLIDWDCRRAGLPTRWSSWTRKGRGAASRWMTRTRRRGCRRCGAQPVRTYIKLWALDVVELSLYNSLVYWSARSQSSSGLGDGSGMIIPQGTFPSTGQKCRRYDALICFSHMSADAVF